MSDLEKIAEKMRQYVLEGAEHTKLVNFTVRVHKDTLTSWANTIEQACKPSTNEEPKNLCDSVEILLKVLACVRSVKSTFMVGSEKWSLAIESCTEIDNAIQMLYLIPEASNDPMTCVTDCHKPDLHLDVSLEKARALHRVWRALNDGDCPACHNYHQATDMHRKFDGIDGVGIDGIMCPTCYFFVTTKEIEEIEKLFAPAMDAAVDIFRKWRTEREAVK